MTLLFKTKSLALAHIAKYSDEPDKFTVFPQKRGGWFIWARERYFGRKAGPVRIDENGLEFIEIDELYKMRGRK